MEAKEIENIIQEIEEVKSLIEIVKFELKKNLTDGICLIGSNLHTMETLLKNKYVSKKELRKRIKQQYEYLNKIEESKNKAISIL